MDLQSIKEKFYSRCRKRPTRKDWIKMSIMMVLYIIFLVWAQSTLGILGIPLLFDYYITRWIHWPESWKESENPVVRKAVSWADAILFALVAVYFVNIYFFQNFTIPSSSLEKSLLTGDYLMVSKTSYGVRIPQTPLHMPLCQHTLPLGLGKSYIESVQWDYKRIHASRVPLNDIVVFNYPAGDTILTMEQYQTQYYDMAYRLGEQVVIETYGEMPRFLSKDSLDRCDEKTRRIALLQQRNFYDQLYQMGRKQLQYHQSEVGEIAWRPVDRRENYVKRCVGTPGDTLQIKERVIYLNGKPNKQPDKCQFNYDLQLKTQIPDDFAHDHEISKEDMEIYATNGYMPLTQEARKALAARRDLVDGPITPHEYGPEISLYPQNMHKDWTQNDYGPIWIPAKGATLKLTLDNLPVYERCIRVYEGNKLEVSGDGRILINGKETDQYTFKMDYYWMMGDNRNNSADSRYWGFVPEDHIVGKPIIIWMSLDPDRSLFNGKIRWNRLFRWVDNIK